MVSAMHEKYKNGASYQLTLLTTNEESWGLQLLM